jgi:5,6-dimethylbenzimidazole synthase
MNIDQFLELVKKRRSIRQFKSEPIPNDAIQKIIEAARWSMSGANGQPWEFVVVKDQKAKDRMADSYMEIRKEQFAIEKTRIEELRHPYFVSPPKDIPGLREAPVVIVACGDRRTLQASTLSGVFLPPSAGPENNYVCGMACAVFSLHLAAAALGLASQWMGTSRVWEASLKSLLDIPELLEIFAVVPIGYPAYDPPPAYRREFEEIVHFDRYDQKKFRSGEEMVQFFRELRKRTSAGYRQGVKNNK